jgi:ribosomal protein S18 acetylase RimI-like enzyme
LTEYEHAFHVRPVRRHEAGELRTIRLAALAADPDAFGSTYAREVGRPPAWWERWAADSDDGRDARTFVAIDAAGRWLGLALVRRDAAEPGTAVLHAMWVAPEARRRGAARALCDACAGWARARGVDTVALGVAEGNGAAIAAYRAAGFAVAGETTSTYGERTLREVVMRRRLEP